MKLKKIIIPILVTLNLLQLNFSNQTLANSTIKDTKLLNSFYRGMSYAEIRQIMFKNGWRPYPYIDLENLPSYTLNLKEEKGYKEFGDCSGTGMALCWFKFLKENKTVTIITAGQPQGTSFYKILPIEYLGCEPVEDLIIEELENLSGEQRLLTLPQQGISLLIPKEFRAMLLNNGNVHIIDKITFELSNSNRNFCGGDILYSLDINYIENLSSPELVNFINSNNQIAILKSNDDYPHLYIAVKSRNKILTIDSFIYDRDVGGTLPKYVNEKLNELNTIAESIKLLN